MSKCFIIEVKSLKPYQMLYISNNPVLIKHDLPTIEPLRDEFDLNSQILDWRDWALITDCIFRSRSCRSICSFVGLATRKPDQ